MSDRENGHAWGEVLDGMLGDRYPQVCVRCLVRSDRPDADRPCDALSERVARWERE